jgi:lipopolysaccharide cholinephosphotransferase
MSAAALQEVQTAPFENLTIDIPAGYDEVLTSMYNDYMTMRQENSCHGGVLFDTERSYLDYLR